MDSVKWKWSRSRVARAKGSRLPPNFQLSVGTKPSPFRVRPVFLVLLVATIIGAAYYSFIYVPRHSKAGQPVFILPNYILTYSPLQPVGEAGYVLPATLQVWDSPAMIRSVIATLKSGDQVYVLARYREWSRVRIPRGRSGWVQTNGLIDAKTHEADERLLKEMLLIPPQAAGHAVNTANVHVEPVRDSAIVAQLLPNERLEIYGRRMVARPAPAGADDDLPVPTRVSDAWYLVSAGSRAGWILGRLIDLDVPAAISSYAQTANIVAWFTLDAISDNGRQIPQYLIADREGNENCDFTHVRVLTWWKRKQTYAVAFVEGNLTGYFPILVNRQGSIPQFRLRLVGSDGQKFQKVYGLFDTITRSLGTVEGWDSDAMPSPETAGGKRRHGRGGERRR